MNNNKWQVTEFHGNGTKKTEQLSLGRLVKVKKYFEGGELQLEGDFIDGKPEGLHVIYFQSGGIHMTTNYVSGVGEGEEVKYYESGEKFHVANCKNGKYEGKFTAYYKNGNIQSTISLVKGSRLGETIDYYESGSIRAVRDFSSHDVQEATAFYENGVIQSKATLINNELDGVFEGYDENGKLAIRQIYKQGELISDEFMEGPQSNSMQDSEESQLGAEDDERNAINSVKNESKVTTKYHGVFQSQEDLRDDRYKRLQAEFYGIQGPHGWYCSKCDCGWVSEKEIKNPFAGIYSQEIEYIKPSCPNCGSRRNVGMSNDVKNEILRRRLEIELNSQDRKRKLIILVAILIIIIVISIILNYEVRYY